jgi:uncharacterized protein YbbC (DUF1343 family)
MISKLFKSTYFFLVFQLFFIFCSCGQTKKAEIKSNNNLISEIKNEIEPAAQQMHLYLNLLQNKRVGVVANQTSALKNSKGYVHLIDTLLQSGIKVVKAFAPEHGFRGDADASETVLDGIDQKTGIPIISLYGKNKKPTAEQLKNCDIIVFDIQDVGVRFYTYISTLHYVMEACAENNIPLIVLDRPNPNGHYIDGPTLQDAYKSFVGMHPIPLVYGMTIGEFAQMIIGEKWLNTENTCDLTIIPLKNYTHTKFYSLPIKPSPNLPNDTAINLYPSLGFFEGTTINAGRGTNAQFQQYGAPFFPKSQFSYTPKPNIGAKNPKHLNKLCYGVNLEHTKRLDSINLEWLLDAYTKTPKNETFFGPTFTIHAGNTLLEEQIKNGVSAQKIRESWQIDIERFKKIRAKYLLYN